MNNPNHMRRAILRGLLGAGGTLALGACGTMGQSAAGASRLSGGKVSVRWLGGGIVELATPDYKQIAYGDAWFWNNAGWTRFNVQKPAEYSSPQGFAQYVAGKKPEAVWVLLTHDHGDHMGDYFDALKALNGAGLPVQTAGQSDLMRKGLLETFKSNGLDPSKIVSNGGAAMNFGGMARHGQMTARLVPAVHSNLLGFPAAGFIVEIGGTRVYISGDTDLFSEMKTIGERYQPNVACICVGNGPFTMGPEDAAQACQWLGVQHAIPIHYAHNPFVRGVEGGEQFRQAMARIAPGVQVSVMKPGETQVLST